MELRPLLTNARVVPPGSLTFFALHIQQLGELMIEVGSPDQNYSFSFSGMAGLMSPFSPRKFVFVSRPNYESRTGLANEKTLPEVDIHK